MAENLSSLVLCENLTVPTWLIEHIYWMIEVLKLVHTYQATVFVAASRLGLLAEYGISVSYHL